MKKIFVVLFAAVIFFANIAYASEIDGIKYWNGDLNCPIFEETGGVEMICFNINSARASKKFDMGDGGKLIELTGYAVAASKIFETNTNYFVWVGKNDKFTVIYPESSIFANGKIFYAEDSIQIKILNKIAKKVYN